MAEEEEFSFISATTSGFMMIRCAPRRFAKALARLEMLDATSDVNERGGATDDDENSRFHMSWHIIGEA